MNEIVKAPTRRHWTLADLDRLADLGFFGETEHVELIGGELYQMAPKGIRHENVRALVADHLVRRLGPDISLHAELGWRPTTDIYLEPDFLVCRAGARVPRIPAAEVLLVIEIAVSSLAYDRGFKAETYAALGVAEYWVIDAERLTTLVHRRPTPDRGYLETHEVVATETLVPLLAAGLTLRLANIDFDTNDEDKA